MLARLLGLGTSSSKSSSSKSAQTLHKPLKSRLGCELLENREVPTVNYWLGGTGLFTDAGNWSDGVPTSGDDLIFDGTLVQSEFPNFGLSSSEFESVGDLGEGGHSAPPSPPPPPVFNSNLGVTFVSNAGNVYNSIHLRNSYTGTVTIPLNVTFGGFEQTTGDIKQSNTPEMGTQTEAYTITVDGSIANGGEAGDFVWTGGTLNSGVNAGVVSIVAVPTATIGNGTDTSYSLGSDLKLLDGTVLSASGNIVLSNEAGLEINDYCVFQGAQPGSGDPPPKSWADLLKANPPGPNQTQVPGIGSVLVKGGVLKGIGTTKLPVLIRGGEFRIEGDKDTVVEGDFGGHPEGSTVNVLMEQDNGGKIVIEEGRTLKAAWVSVRAGLLTTKVKGSVPNHMAIIDGDLTVVGGVVQIATEGRPSGAFVPTLHISGDMSFTDGVYKPTVFSAGGNIHDRWTCSGKLTSDPDAKITPTVVGTPTAGLAWDVIIAMSGFEGTGRPTISTAGWATSSGDGTGQGHPEYGIIYIHYPTS